MCLPADSDLCNALPVVSDTNHGRGEPSPCVHRGLSGLLLHRACTNPAWTRRISTSRSTSGYSTFASWSTVKVTSVHPEILGQGGEVVVGAAGSALLRATVFEQRRRQDPAVPAHQPVPDETCIEEFDHVRARDTQQPSGLLVVSSACAGTTITPWPAAMFASTARITSSAAAGRCTDSEVPATVISTVSAPAVGPQ